MKITKIVGTFILILLAAFSASGVAYAQTPPATRPAALRGEITTVSSSGFSLNTPAGDDITVNVTADTRIWLAETRSEGSLTDIAAGKFAGVRGTRHNDGSVTARGVLVLAQNPHDLDRMHGKVIAMEGSTLVVENRAGEQQRIVTDENTRVRIGRQPGSLADINLDDPVLALGNLQGDGSLQAKLVTVVTPPQIRRHTLRGEVLSVDAAAGKLTVAATGQKEGTWTITTTDQTRYRASGIDNPTLADIAVGNQVVIVGRAATEEKSGIAWAVAVIPQS